jgi:hypothetical protein
MIVATELVDADNLHIEMGCCPSGTAVDVHITLTLTRPTHGTWIIPVPAPWSVSQVEGDSTMAWLVSGIDRLDLHARALFADDYGRWLGQGFGFWVVPLGSDQVYYGLRYRQTRMFVPCRVNQPMQRRVLWEGLDMARRRRWHRQMPVEWSCYWLGWKLCDRWWLARDSNWNDYVE